MSKVRFRLYNTHLGDHIAVIEMDEALLAPEAEVLDHETMKLKGIKHGSQFTLIPIEDHTVATLKLVKTAYENTQKGANYLSTHMSRVDAMADAIRLLFSDVEYVVVESKTDLEKIINPNLDRDYEIKRVKYNVLGDMLAGAEAATGEEDGHVHGPDCKH